MKNLNSIYKTIFIYALIAGLSPELIAGDKKSSKELNKSIADILGNYKEPKPTPLRKFLKLTSKDENTLTSYVNMMQRMLNKYGKGKVGKNHLKTMLSHSKNIDELYEKYGSGSHPVFLEKKYEKLDQGWINVISHAQNIGLDFIALGTIRPAGEHFSNPRGTKLQIGYYHEALKKFKAVRNTYGRSTASK